MKKLRCVLLLALFLGQQALHNQDKGPRKLTVSANPPPTPALRFALLPELRDQVPGNAAPHYRKAADVFSQIVKGNAGLFNVIDQWERLPIAQLPRADVRVVMGLLKEPLALLDRATHSEFCDWELTQRLREQGFAALLPEIQQLRLTSQIYTLKARLELADDRPDLALGTLRNSFTMAKNVGEAPPLICHLVGIALASRTNGVLEKVLAHPKTPNLYWSLASLPHPLIDGRKSLESEHLSVYGTFPQPGTGQQS